PQAVLRNRSSLRRPPGRLHAHPQARPPPRRQRADGAHRIRVTLFDDAETASSIDYPVRVRMTVAYDGTGFHGFAAHPGIKTVGGTLAAGIAKVLGYPIELTCAGRTDKGVHAWGQVVSFDAEEFGLDLDGLQRSLNRMLGPAIVVRDAQKVHNTFDARRSAVARRYRYTVLNRDVPDPFLARTSWH